MTEKTKYRCPMCGDNDLRIEVPVIAVLHDDGGLSFRESCDQPEHINHVTPTGLVACMNEECEFSGDAPLFKAEYAPHQAMAMARDIARMYKEGETFEGGAYVMENDDNFDTLCSLISAARGITGMGDRPLFDDEEEAAGRVAIPPFAAPHQDAPGA